MFLVELEEDGNQYSAESKEWQVDPEYPTPGDVLRETTTCIIVSDAWIDSARFTYQEEAPQLSQGTT